MYNRNHGALKERIRYLFLLFILAIAAILIYKLNAITPLALDDRDYSFSFATGERITCLRDVLESQRAHYSYMNGRFVTHTFAQVFLLLGKPIFNVINVTAFLLLGLLICYHGTGKNPVRNPISLVFVYCALFLFTPAFGQSFLWLDGSSNYLFGILLILIYLIPYRYAIAHSTVRSKGRFPGILKFLLMTAFGFFAGATNENTSVAMIAMVIAFLIYYKGTGIPCRLWMYAPGVVAGCLCMLLAPGQRVRLQNAGGSNLSLLFNRFVDISKTCIKNFYPLLLFFLFLALLFIYSRREMSLTKETILTEGKKLGVTSIYLLGFLGATYSMIVSPVFARRVWSGPLILLLVTILALSSVCASPFEKRVRKTALYAMVCALAIYTMSVYPQAMRDLTACAEANDAREAKIAEAKAAGETVVYLPSISSKSKYSAFPGYGDLVDDPDQWPNRTMAIYYGLDKIILDKNA